MNNNINLEDILIYPIDSPEFLQCVNGLRMPNSIIDWKALLNIICDKNEEFCEENDLCQTCHREFETYDEHSEHFGRPVSEKVKCCPKCG